MKLFKILTGSLVFFALSGCSVQSKTQSHLSSMASASQCKTALPMEQDPVGLAYGPSCQELLTKFPDLDQPENTEDKRILCPFLRIIKRSGAIAEEIAANLSLESLKNKLLPISVGSLASATAQFGCSSKACGDVAGQVSAGQNSLPLTSIDAKSIVDLGRLDTASGVAHDCGFTFALGETSLSPETRAASLAQFKVLAVDGRLDFAAIMQVKKNNCMRDFNLAARTGQTTKNLVNASNTSLELSRADLTEVNLIFSYLGGIDQGYILYSDLERFFQAEIPFQKTKYLIDAPLFAHLQQVLSKKLSP